jgi:hypothetical protein
LDGQAPALHHPRDHGARFRLARRSAGQLRGELADRYDMVVAVKPQRDRPFELGPLTSRATLSHRRGPHSQPKVPPQELANTLRGKREGRPDFPQGRTFDEPQA